MNVNGIKDSPDIGVYLASLFKKIFTNEKPISKDDEKVEKREEE